jgi:hypothetical protein
MEMTSDVGALVGTLEQLKARETRVRDRRVRIAAETAAQEASALEKISAEETEIWGTVLDNVVRDAPDLGFAHVKNPYDKREVHVRLIEHGKPQVMILQPGNEHYPITLLEKKNMRGMERWMRGWDPIEGRLARFVPLFLGGEFMGGAIGASELIEKYSTLPPTADMLLAGLGGLILMLGSYFLYRGAGPWLSARHRENEYANIEAIQRVYGLPSPSKS